MYKSLVLPLLATLILHCSLLAIFLVDWQDDYTKLVKAPPPRYIRAELVVMDKPKAKPAPAAKPAPPKPTPPKPVVDTKAAEQKRQAEVNKQQEVKRQQDEAKRKAALAAKQKAEQETKRKADQAAKQKAEQDAKRKAEQTAQQKAEQQRQQAAKELADAMAAEEAQQQASTDSELATSYIALIADVIQSNWSRPPSARNGMETELIIQLTPSGDVVSVQVVKSSGDAAFDRAAENAVMRAGRFPELQKLPIRVFEQYFRRLRLQFRPEDLRL